MRIPTTFLRVAPVVSSVLLVGGLIGYRTGAFGETTAAPTANISPLMDVLFGTYRCPDHEPERFGISEPAPRSYLGHLVRPFLPRRTAGTPNAPVVASDPVSS